MTWDMATIGAVCSTYSGGTPSTANSEYYGGNIPWIASAELNQGRITSTRGRISKLGLERSAAKMVEPGTPLIALYGATAGVPAITSIGGAINQAVLAMVPRGVDAEFLYQWLRANRDEIIDRYTQGGQPNLSGAIVRSIEIPLPSRSEQERVSGALRDADDLITTLERLIAKKQAIKQGMMQQLLTGRTRLPGFTGDWQPARLGELLAYEQPGRYLVSSADYTDTGTPVLTAGKTFMLGHTSERHGIFTKLPVIIFDDFTTASKYVDFPFKAKSSAMKMLSARPGVNLRYIFERMQLIDFVTVDHKRRWIAEFSKIEILTPGEEEQVAIAGVLEDADTEIAVLARRLEKTQAIKTGMMQQLLTGRTRLPAEAAS